MIEKTIFETSGLTVEIERTPIAQSSYSPSFQLVKQRSYSGFTSFIDRRANRKVLSFTFDKLNRKDFDAFMYFFETVKESLTKFDLTCVPLSAELFKTGLRIDGQLVTSGTIIHGELINTSKPYSVWDSYTYEDVFFEPSSVIPQYSNRGKLVTISPSIVIES